MSRSGFGWAVLLWGLLCAPLMGHGQQTFLLTPHYRTIALSGLTYPGQEMMVVSEVSGRCLHIDHDVGEAITATGQFAQLDTTFLTLDLEANQLARQQTLRKLEQDRKTLQRFTVLRNKDSTTEAEYDEMQLAVDLTELRLKALQNQQTRLAERLVRHTITAPPGWRVIERFVEPGEFVVEGQQVASLGDFSQLRLKVALTFQELEQVQSQQPLMVYFPDLAERVAAELSQISPSVAPDTRKIPVEILIGRRQVETIPTLRGGLRGVLEIVMSNEQHGYLVPATALLSGYDAHWLVRTDGTRQPVILLDELETGALAVVAGDQLQAGMEFLVTPRPPP